MRATKVLPPRGRWPEGSEGVGTPGASAETPSVASRQLPLWGSIFFLALAASFAQAAPGPVVNGAWSRPAAAGMTGAGFLTLGNPRAAVETLVGVESPAAARVEVHRSSMAGGVMSMQRQDRLDVPARGKVQFGPGGYHLMLIGLKQPLKLGDRVPVTLKFASGARVEAALVVAIKAP